MPATGTLPLIELAAPTLGEAERQALAEVITSGWLTMGERVRAFETAFAQLHGVPDAVAVSSATAALHLALAAHDIGPGTEVLVPSMTFVATVNAVVAVGATPVFVDVIAPDTPHLDLVDARRRLTSRTRAVVVLPYGGYAMDLAPWRAFADEHGLTVVEDAAHCAGTTGPTGVLGPAAFSFFTNKNMTTAEGGMLLEPDPERRERARRMRAHGMTASTLDRDRGRAVGYDVLECGHNFRMDELRGALGLVQLERLPAWNARRRELSAHYRAALAAELPGVTVPFPADHPTTAHLLPVVLPAGTDRAAVMAALRADGVQSSVHYPPVHLFTAYRGADGDAELPRTTEFGARELTLPLHPSLTTADVDRVVAGLRNALAGASRL
jgi:dTDP-4-amino-4,6-dideoxygalactose transaminase